MDNRIKSLATAAPYKFFYQFFLLNLISNYVILGVSCTLVAILSVIALSAFIAWCEWLVYRLLTGKGEDPARRSGIRKSLSYIYYALLLIFQNFLLATDYFLLIKFKTVISQQSIDLFMGTNASEAAEFLSSYMPWGTLFMALVLLVALNVAVYLAASWLAHRFAASRVAAWIRRILVAAGVLIIMYMLVMFVRFHHGAQIPTFTSITRFGYGWVQRFQNNRKTARLAALCRNTEVGESAQPEFDIVFILGESFSRWHTPLYEYDKETTPRLSQLAADSSLIVFDDVVTTEDWTQKVLMSLFSTGRYNGSFGNHPLFPVLLRKAGWRTELYDNEFLPSHDTFFFNRSELSEMMFDYRNDEMTRYDGELADRMQPGEKPTFHMLHLIGQHFQYADRYPADRARFTEADYDKTRFTDIQRDILAHYDNSTLYNDSIVGSVIDRWADRDCIVIYFTDHGEEIYDCRDYFGHGNALSAEDIRYQIQIPFVVYTSEKFRANHPEIQEALRKAATKPVSTDDFSHFVLDLAGVDTPELDRTRSFISEKYDSTRPRYVLKSVNFDEWTSSKKQ